MRLQSRWIPVLSLALLGTLIAATTMKGVSYKSTSSIEISGLVGELLDKAGVDTFSEETFFDGNKMATKNKTSRTIIDLDAETITSVNDKTKTYTVMSFDQLAGLFTPGDGQAPEQEPTEEPDYTVTVTFWIDEMGTAEVHNERVDHFRLHVLADPEPTSEDIEDPGQFALAMELFMRDVEGYEVIKNFQQGYADKIGRGLGGGQGNLFDAIKTVLGDSPGIRESLERSQDEINKMDKMTVRLITHIVTIPPGKEYDPEMVFGEKKKKKKKKGGLGRFAKKIARQATGEGEDEKDKEQKTILTSTTDHEGFTTGPIDPMVFEIGADYTEQDYSGSGGN